MRRITGAARDGARADGAPDTVPVTAVVAAAARGVGAAEVSGRDGASKGPLPPIAVDTPPLPHAAMLRMSGDTRRGGVERVAFAPAGAAALASRVSFGGVRRSDTSGGSS
jgi:hypothetical protein